MSNLKLKLLLLGSLVLFVSSYSVANAYESERSYSNYSKSYKYKEYRKSNKQYAQSNKKYSKESRSTQNQFRSRSDVMSEVKQRYNAKVLKISLNEKSGTYSVRVLMPNGKVRSLQVSARK